MLETREGGCHCGRVRFRAKVDLDLLSQCSCSICTKKGILHLPVFPADFELLLRKSRRSTVACANQVLYAVHCGYSAARARRRTCQSGRRAAEFKCPRKVPTLNLRVGEARVKNVSGAGRVDRIDFKRRAVVELRSIPGQYAILSQCSRRHPIAEAFGKGPQGNH